MIEPENSIMCLDYNRDGSVFATAGKDFHVIKLIFFYIYKKFLDNLIKLLFQIFFLIIISINYLNIYYLII